MADPKINFNHIPVLLDECIEGLKIKEDGIYVDGTLGGAGHSLKIVEKLSLKGLLIGIDRDEEALEESKKRLSNFENVIYINDNHDNLKNILKQNNIEKVDGILLDLGVSSYQLDEEERGFSYISNAKLDMRMDQKQKLTAFDVVNTYKEDELSNIIYKYGEEKNSRKIARRICEARKNAPIETTKQLADIILECIKTNKRASSKKNISSD